MTFTKTLMLSAAAATVLMIGSGAAWAETTVTDPGNCGLNQNQANKGFYCTETVTVTPISREIGGGSRCQNATRTTFLYQSYNHRGSLQEADDRVLVVEPEDSAWGSSYSKPAGGCTYGS